ncbi:hypothetical protein VaNZ11_009519, partial [Volvox africanus]
AGAAGAGGISMQASVPKADNLIPGTSLREEMYGSLEAAAVTLSAVVEVCLPPKEDLQLSTQVRVTYKVPLSAEGTVRFTSDCSASGTGSGTSSGTGTGSGTGSGSRSAASGSPGTVDSAGGSAALQGAVQCAVLPAPTSVGQLNEQARRDIPPPPGSISTQAIATSNAKSRSIIMTVGAAVAAAVVASIVLGVVIAMRRRRRHLEREVQEMAVDTALALTQPSYIDVYGALAPLPTTRSSTAAGDLTTRFSRHQQGRSFIRRAAVLLEQVAAATAREKSASDGGAGGDGGGAGGGGRRGSLSRNQFERPAYASVSSRTHSHSRSRSSSMTPARGRALALFELAVPPAGGAASAGGSGSMTAGASTTSGGNRSRRLAAGASRFRAAALAARFAVADHTGMLSGISESAVDGSSGASAAAMAAASGGVSLTTAAAAAALLGGRSRSTPGPGMTRLRDGVHPELGEASVLSAMTLREQIATARAAAIALLAGGSGAGGGSGGSGSCSSGGGISGGGGGMNRDSTVRQLAAVATHGRCLTPGRVSTHSALARKSMRVSIGAVASASASGTAVAGAVRPSHTGLPLHAERSSGGGGGSCGGASCGGGGSCSGGRTCVRVGPEPGLGAANELEGGGSAADGAAGPYFGPGRLPASCTPSHQSCQFGQRNGGVHVSVFAAMQSNNDQLDAAEVGPLLPGSAERTVGRLLESHPEICPRSSYPQYPLPPALRLSSPIVRLSACAGQTTSPQIRVQMDAPAGTAFTQLRQRQTLRPELDPSDAPATAAAAAAAAATATTTATTAASTVQNTASASRSVSVSVSSGSSGTTGVLTQLREVGAQIADTPMVVVAAAAAASVAETHGSVHEAPPAPSFIQDQAIRRATTLQQWLQPRQVTELWGHQAGHASPPAADANASVSTCGRDLDFIPELRERATWASPRTESASGSGLGFHSARGRRRYTMATASLVAPEPGALEPEGGELAATAISASTHFGALSRGRSHRLSSIGRNAVTRLSGADGVAIPAAAMPTSLIAPVVHVESEVYGWEGLPSMPPPPPPPVVTQSVTTPHSAPLPVPAVLLLPAVLPNRPDAENEDEGGADMMCFQPM